MIQWGISVIFMHHMVKWGASSDGHRIYAASCEIRVQKGVIWPEFRMRQYRDDDHRKTHPTLQYESYCNMNHIVSYYMMHENHKNGFAGCDSLRILQGLTCVILRTLP